MSPEKGPTGRFEKENQKIWRYSSEVSAHGHTEHNKQAVLAIADAIRMVPPVG
jgi:hypothetical protein